EYPTVNTVKKVFGSWRRALDEAGVLPVREQRWRNLDPAIGHWLAGFIAGEGHFRIHCSKSGHYYSAAFAIKLRDDDSEILEELRRCVGLGTIYRQVRRSGNSKPACVWVLQSRADCQELVEILDVYPLRSRKATDYAIWRRAVAVWSTMPRGNRWRGQRNWEAMIRLKRELESARTYRPRAAAWRSLGRLGGRAGGLTALPPALKSEHAWPADRQPSLLSA
ncbi:MAG TPA: LAGLIDADG family homing endonuclease, partial [Chloroflexota bacterium]